MHRGEKVTIREFEAGADKVQVEKLDTSYSSSRALRVKYENGIPCLEWVGLPAEISKRFPIDLTQEPCKKGYVADRDGEILGFIGTDYHAWNQRLVIWHFYVAPGHRRLGIGRRLMDPVLEYSRTIDAVSVWVETSNFNSQAIDAYRKLGFTVSGFDANLYFNTKKTDEFAIFLSRTDLERE